MEAGFILSNTALKIFRAVFLCGNISIDEALEKCQKVYFLKLQTHDTVYYILLAYATNFSGFSTANVTVQPVNSCKSDNFKKYTF